MTQHTPQNNRSTINTSYSHKVRGTQKRSSRVRVKTIGKSSFPEKQHRSCPRCKESTNSMKLLNARVEKIEQLVDVLAKTTRGLASSLSKREDRFAQSSLKFRGIDLSRCTLQDLQKLVVATTSIMVPSKPDNPITTDKKIFHSEPASMEDIKIIEDKPIKTIVSSLKKVPPRQDSGYGSGGEPESIKAD